MDDQETNPAAPTALVTGSTRGIGKAIADMLRQRGVHVLTHGSGDGPTGRAQLSADLDDPAAPAQLWADALAAVRAAGRTRIDILINNAGLFDAAPIDLSDIAWLDAWDRTLRINLSSAAQLSRLAVRHWQEGGNAGGRLVNIASRAAYRGDSPDHWHYAAAKSGLVAMGKTIARHYAGDGILAYTVCPGFVDTAMVGDGANASDAADLARDIPLGRVARPEEIARIAAFCALDAPESMTGAVIDANGASFVR
ncbi:SDR family NAD(P)-dependent oxidoreductase [Croceicoccus sp. YJ47]|uniref:SDR family NAD(P)-dependent oxidoreductase n=1 Tax=Croceicoccus sp. YJ47 TaxID=2798724 RepID=UPI0019222A70|nr:SDR family oxidoreductase [Croceicoccus sp. YJ47]QQN73465.1 SDR family oxidoreductase [Croceicoccus sp. YJ47]